MLYSKLSPFNHGINSNGTPIEQSCT